MKLIIRMLIVLTLIGVISGALLSQISNWAEPQIEAHRKEATARAVFIVQNDGKSYEQVKNIDFEAYKVFSDNENKDFIGYSLPCEGNGFQGKVRLMVGLKPDLKEITGMVVLEQVETPGLGTKIVSDPSVKEDPEWFPNQFKGVICDPTITVVKNQKPSNNKEIQAITGATITSKSVVKIVADGLVKLRSIESGVKNEK